MLWDRSGFTCVVAGSPRRSHASVVMLVAIVCLASILLPGTSAGKGCDWQQQRAHFISGQPRRVYEVPIGGNLSITCSVWCGDGLFVSRNLYHISSVKYVITDPNKLPTLAAYRPSPRQWRNVTYPIVSMVTRTWHLTNVSVANGGDYTCSGGTLKKTAVNTIRVKIKAPAPILSFLAKRQRPGRISPSSAIIVADGKKSRYTIYVIPSQTPYSFRCLIRRSYKEHLKVKWIPNQGHIDQRSLGYTTHVTLRGVGLTFKDHVPTGKYKCVAVQPGGSSALATLHIRFKHGVEPSMLLESSDDRQPCDATSATIRFLVSGAPFPTVKLEATTENSSISLLVREDHSGTQHSTLSEIDGILIEVTSTYHRKSTNAFRVLIKIRRIAVNTTAPVMLVLTAANVFGTTNYTKLVDGDVCGSGQNHPKEEEDDDYQDTVEKYVITIVNCQTRGDFPVKWFSELLFATASFLGPEVSAFQYAAFTCQLGQGVKYKDNITDAHSLAIVIDRESTDLDVKPMFAGRDLSFWRQLPDFLAQQACRPRARNILIILSDIPDTYNNAKDIRNALQSCEQVSSYPPHVVSILPFMDGTVQHLAYRRSEILDSYRPSRGACIAHCEDPVIDPQFAANALVALNVNGSIWNLNLLHDMLQYANIIPYLLLGDLHGFTIESGCNIPAANYPCGSKPQDGWLFLAHLQLAMNSSVSQITISPTAYISTDRESNLEGDDRELAAMQSILAGGEGQHHLMRIVISVVVPICVIKAVVLIILFVKHRRLKIRSVNCRLEIQNNQVPMTPSIPQPDPVTESFHGLLSPIATRTLRSPLERGSQGESPYIPASSPDSTIYDTVRDHVHASGPEESNYVVFQAPTPVSKAGHQHPVRVDLTASRNKLERKLRESSEHSHYRLCTFLPIETEHQPQQPEEDQFGEFCDDVEVQPNTAAPFPFPDIRATQASQTPASNKPGLVRKNSGNSEFSAASHEGEGNNTDHLFDPILFHNPQDETMFQDQIPQYSRVTEYLPCFSPTVIGNYGCGLTIICPTRQGLYPSFYVSEALSKPVSIARTSSSSHWPVSFDLTLYTTIYLERSDFQRFQINVFAFTNTEWVFERNLTEGDFIWDDYSQKSCRTCLAMKKVGTYILAAVDPSFDQDTSIPTSLTPAQSISCPDHQHCESQSGHGGCLSLPRSSYCPSVTSHNPSTPREVRAEKEENIFPGLSSTRDVSRDVYFLPLAKKYLNGGNGRVWSMKFFIFQASLRKQAPDDMASKICVYWYIENRYYTCLLTQPSQHQNQDYRCPRTIRGQEIKNVDENDILSFFFTMTENDDQFQFLDDGGSRLYPINYQLANAFVGEMYSHETADHSLHIRLRPPVEHSLTFQDVTLNGKMYKDLYPASRYKTSFGLDVNFTFYREFQFGQDTSPSIGDLPVVTGITGRARDSGYQSVQPRGGHDERRILTRGDRESIQETSNDNESNTSSRPASMSAEAETLASPRSPRGGHMPNEITADANCAQGATGGDDNRTVTSKDERGATLETSHMEYENDKHDPGLVAGRASTGVGRRLSEEEVGRRPNTT